MNNHEKRNEQYNKKNRSSDKNIYLDARNGQTEFAAENDAQNVKKTKKSKKRDR